MFSTKIASWLAIVAAVCFLILIVLQIVELSSYRAAPSVWPVSL
jgi:hypothetical protein